LGEIASSTASGGASSPLLGRTEALGRDPGVARGLFERAPAVLAHDPHGGVPGDQVVEEPDGEQAIRSGLAGGTCFLDQPDRHTILGLLVAETGEQPVVVPA